MNFINKVERIDTSYVATVAGVINCQLSKMLPLFLLRTSSAVSTMIGFPSHSMSTTNSNPSPLP